MRSLTGSQEKAGPSGPGDTGGEGRAKARAIVTIVSANYLSRARALCRSVMEHEPGVLRFVLLVERRSAKVLRDDEPFEAIWAEDLGIPEFEDFMAQYTVVEANTAVKPYVLAHLFEKCGVDRLVYLDPDTLLTAPLPEVWRALDRGSVVLIPHLCDPFRDAEHPTELQILRSGTYNLGFIALRRGASADRLLSWWADKTEYDCVVDLANGLFVDQKWMDLVPGYVDDVVVLRDPGYNVAYWNLHERRIREVSGQYFANDLPLSFYHFSGYEVDRPWTISRHQSRHDLHSMPTLKGLFDAYRDLLLAEHHEEVKSLPYSFGTLGNGVPISPAIRQAVRLFRKQGIDWPSVRHADAFCRFVMTPNAAVCGTEISPFVFQVLARRPDVASAYPRARQDAGDPGFLHWLENSGHEVESETLCARFKATIARVNPFDRVLRVYERRDDVRAAYPEAFKTREGLEAFAGWLRRYSVRETNLEREEVDAFVEAGRTGFEAVVEYYLSSPELHARFPLALLPCGGDFVEWLVREGMRGADLSVAQIRWFERRRTELDANALVVLTALRNEWVRLRFPLGATVFGWPELSSWVRAQAANRGVPLPVLKAELPHSAPMALQLEALHATGTFAREFPGAMRSRVKLRQFAEAAIASLPRPLPSNEQERLEHTLSSYSVVRGINVAGYFHYSAGVGSSVRTLANVIATAGIPHTRVTLPVCPSQMTSFEPDPSRLPDRFWQQHRPDFEVDITVANADALRAARAFVGLGYGRDRKHIGYWVWETDCLPGKYAAAAEGLDAIWTPSEFSARGLRNTVGPGIRVEVVPHAIAPAKPEAGQHPIALPDSTTLIGFFFDARSVIARKNPEALLRAFRLAFRKDDRVALVLKVNHTRNAPEIMRRLEALAEGLPVIWIRDVLLDEAETSSLLSRLDIYASLHRSEGFGLVLAEAMALGKPVVATGFSANVEFMDDSCARLLRYEEIVTDRAHGPYPRGTSWAEPDVEHAADVLRSLVRDRELQRELGRRAKRRIEQLLSPAAVARTLLSRLGWDAGEFATAANGDRPPEAERREAEGEAPGRSARPDPAPPRAVSGG